MDKTRNPELSIILPCRNEEKALPSCLKQIKEVINENKINAEIIVSDSSADSSPNIAKKFKVRLVKHDKEGYGIACLEGFKAAKGKYLLMADCDGTYNFNSLPKFLRYLREGYDLVIGNRFSGEMEEKAMPWHHKYIGNPLLSGLLRVFYRTSVRDIHCGMRAISKEALQKLSLYTTGMEFASEFVIKALRNNLKIKEIPIPYHKRKGESKLKSFSDGWKHLRFMLLYSPLFLFFLPGLLIFAAGLISMFLFYLGSIEFFGLKFFYHPMFLSALLIILGYQVIVFAIFAKTYSITNLGEESPAMERLYKYLTIERTSLIGIAISITGISVYLFIVAKWLMSKFDNLNEVKNSIIALTLFIIGIQTIFSSFMLSILGIKERRT